MEMINKIIEWYEKRYLCCDRCGARLIPKDNPRKCPTEGCRPLQELM
jgi:hypothetical protein